MTITKTPPSDRSSVAPAEVETRSPNTARRGCHVHPYRDADGHCAECGEACCAACLGPIGPRPVCQDCRRRLGQPAPVTDPRDPSAPRYFQVSLTKLAVLSLCSFGLYDMFWFYRHWRTIRDDQQRKVSPFWRTVFAPLFCYALFREIGRGVSFGGLAGRVGPGALAIAYIALDQIGSRLPDPVSWIALLGFLPLLLVQFRANAVNALAAPLAAKNDRFTPWNVVAVFIGGMMWCLRLVGLFVE